MSAILHLTVTTPATVLVDSDDVVSVRAEDASGGFGILPGHADLLTMLIPSVLRWHTASGAAKFCAIQGGVLTVSSGARVAIACREAIVGDALEALEGEVRTARAHQLEADRRARVEQTRIHAAAVRQLVRYLRPERGTHAGMPVMNGNDEAAP
jgi:F-type H+-transporting ATPase subunit epsilon